MIGSLDLNNDGNIMKVILGALLFAVLSSIDLFLSLRSRRTYLFGGSITREHQPDKYWMLMLLEGGVLIISAVVLIKGLILYFR